MSLDGKQRVIAAGFGAISALRADRWLASVARGRGVILTFHHVRPPTREAFQPNKLLEITPATLDGVLATIGRLGFDTVPLEAVPDRLRERGGRPFVALTFDDGFGDNRDYALPILRRYQAPWTLFVTRDYAAGAGRLWWIELEEVVRRSDRIVLSDEGRTQTFPAATEAEKVATFGAIYRDLRAGPEERLRRLLAGWCAGLGLEPASLVRELCLSWADLREMGTDDPRLDFGAHTLTHPMLAKHDAEFAQREIEEGGRAIGARLGRPVTTLAYPVGDPTSAGPREFAFAREAGYRVAVTTRPGHLFASHADHLTALPRVSINGLHQSEAAIRALLSGVPFLVWNRGRRLMVG